MEFVELRHGLAGLFQLGKLKWRAISRISSLETLQSTRGEVDQIFFCSINSGPVIAQIVVIGAA